MKDTAIHGPIIKNKTHLPVLGTVSVKAGRMTSTDLNIWIETGTELPDGLYRQVGGDWVPSPIEPDDFPHFEPVQGPGFEFELDPIAFKRALACASTDKTRHILNSVLFRIEEGGITVAATDGRRLTVFALETKRKPAKSIHGDCVIGHDDGVHHKVALNPLALLLRDKKRTTITATIEHKEGSRRIALDNGEQRITAKLVEGTYPNFHAVIPKELSGLFYVDRTTMADTLKKAIPFTGKKGHALVLTIGPDALGILSEDEGEDLRLEQSIPIRHERRCECKPIALDPHYLLDSFIQEDGPIYVGYEDECSPVCFGTHITQGQIDRNNITVQMPMRIS